MLEGRGGMINMIWFVVRYIIQNIWYRGGSKSEFDKIFGLVQKDKNIGYLDIWRMVWLSSPDICLEILQKGRKGYWISGVWRDYCPTAFLCTDGSSPCRQTFYTILTNLFLPSAYLIGISNCTWSSCRHGCTAEVYKCWQVQVSSSLLQLQPLTKDISLCIWSLLSSELKSQQAQVDIYHIQARPHYQLQLWSLRWISPWCLSLPLFPHPGVPSHPSPPLPPLLSLKLPSQLDFTPMFEGVATHPPSTVMVSTFYLLPSLRVLTIQCQTSSPSLGVWAPSTNAGCLTLIRTLPSQNSTCGGWRGR